MKKIYTLFILLLTLAIGAQADGTKGIKLSFTGVNTAKSASGITVYATDLNGNSIEGVSASLTATSINIFHTHNACANDTILCPSGDSNSGYGNQTEDEITFTFKITGLNSYISNFNQVNLGIVALNSAGEFQGIFSTDNMIRKFSLTVNSGTSIDNFTPFASKENVNINENGNANKTNNFISHKLAGTATSTADTLYLNIVLKKTDTSGCFAGLTNVEIIIPTYTVNWNIKESAESTDIIKSFTEETESGQSATCTIPAYPFTKLTYKNTDHTESSFTVTKDSVTESSSEDIIADFSLPFTKSTSYQDATWYEINSASNDVYHHNEYLYYNEEGVSVYRGNNYTNSQYILGASQTLSGETKELYENTPSRFRWAFIGNPITGFRVINQYAGRDMNVYLADDGTATKESHPLMSNTEQYWTIVNGVVTTTGSDGTTTTTNAGTFSFKLMGADSITLYWNNYDNKPAYHLGLWTGFGAGSKWKVTEVKTGANYTLLTSLFTNNPFLEYLYNNAKNGASALGDGVGQYKVIATKDDDYETLKHYYTTVDDFTYAYETAKSLTDSASINTTTYYQGAIDNAYVKLNNITTLLLNSLNKPTENTFLQIWDGTNYITASSTAGNTSDTFGSDTIDTKGNTIWFYNGTSLRSLSSGFYLNGNSLTTDATQHTAKFSTNPNYLNTYSVCTTKEGSETTDHYFTISSLNEDGTTKSPSVAIVSSEKESVLQLNEVTALPITLNSANSVTVTEKDENTTANYNYFATICLPVNYKINEGIRTFVVTGAETENDESYIVLKEVTGVIPANTAVILLGTSNSATATVNDDTEIADTISYTNYLSGIGEATRLSTDNYYFGKNKNGENGDAGFYKPGTNATNKYITNRGYITANNATVLRATTSSKGFTFAFADNDPTGIINNATAKNADSFDTDAPRYDLKGVRVGKDYKGIVIINGKKYLII